MFDKYFISKGPSHVSHSTTVHEHRAPTDKSVELLKEFEEKAMAKIVETIVIRDTLVEGKAFLCSTFLGTEYDLRGYVKVNGEELEFGTKVKIMDVSRAKEAAAIFVLRATAEAVAQAFVTRLIKTDPTLEEFAPQLRAKFT